MPSPDRSHLRHHPHGVSRRSFIGTLLAAGIAPAFLPARLFGKEAPSNLLRIGCIGVGRIGQQNLRNLISAGARVGARVVALCDVESDRLRQARDLAAEQHKLLHKDSPFEVSLHRDYQELLGRKDIDGVMICTPDHWHGLCAIHAAEAGKGVYLEKPLTYTIREGQALVRTVRRKGIVLQVGTQQRSSTRFHRPAWLVRNGRVGRLREIIVQLPCDGGSAVADGSPIPATLDYNRWLGPIPEVPFHTNRVYHINKRPGWMQIQAHCLGMVTNWGTHMFDIAQWALGCDLDGGPVEIRAQGEFPDRGLFDVHTRFSGEARYANGVLLKSSATLGEDSEGAYIRFVGEDGWIQASRHEFSASNPDLLREKPQGQIELRTSNNHVTNFLECLRAGTEPVAPVEAGHRTNTVCVLHYLSMKLRRPLKWDPAKEEIVGDAEAATHLHYEYRSGYQLPA